MFQDMSRTYSCQSMGLSLAAEPAHVNCSSNIENMATAISQEWLAGILFHIHYPSCRKLTNTIEG